MAYNDFWTVINCYWTVKWSQVWLDLGSKFYMSQVKENTLLGVIINMFSVVSHDKVNDKCTSHITTSELLLTLSNSYT